MSWKSLVCAGLLCGLVVVPAAADPSLSVDLVRDGGGLPVLDASGNWQFSVSVIPDAALFTDPADSPDRGLGGSTAVEVGLEVTQTGGPVATVGSLATTANVINDNPGLSPFGGLVDSVGLDAVAHQIDAFLGSDFFTSAGAKELFTFSAGKPASDLANGSLTVSVDASGGYSSAYRVAQGGSNFDIADAQAFTATVQPGDANLDGAVNFSDVVAISPHFNNPGKIWSQGDFTGNGTFDFSDIVAMSPFFNTSIAPPSGAIPEPASALLVALAGALLAAIRVRR